MSDSRIVEQLNSVIASQPIDEVLVALPMDRYGPLVETIVQQCEEQGISCGCGQECHGCRSPGPTWMN
jgi:hypothetical protein